MDQFMPALPLKGARVVVVGAGEAAENKLRLFRTAPCDLIWRSLDRAAPPPRDLNPNAQILPGKRVPLGAFNGADLVFIAVEDERLARRLVRRAKRAGALVNAVDRMALCDFYTPALVDRGPVTVALSTGGAAPILARDVRAALETVMPAGIGRLAEIARDFRPAVYGALKTLDERRRFWEIALRGRAASLADQGDEPGARAALKQALDDFVQGGAPAGEVYLVGAGPGDPELLTLKAARLLRDADVIVYDRLVSPEILDRARRDAERIDVGKTRGRHPVPQDRICEILVEHARAGRRVVRLKGGDSFVFGRGGEEAEAVRAAGIAVHVVPGVSAALACAASAQAPLTHRDAAQAVTFITGQPKVDGPAIDYAALASANHTVVVYMGLAKAGEIARGLIAAGRPAETPAAAVEKASLPDERVIVTELARLPEALALNQVQGPAAFIIGEVVRYAPAWAAHLADAAQQQTLEAA